MRNDRRDLVRRNPLVPIAGVLIAIAVLAVIAYTYATPYLVLDRLKRAADARDPETVSRYVDYPALRASLKEQVTQMLSRRVETQKREHPLSALGALVGMALIGPLVDSYATPDGVAALLNGIPPRGERGEVLTAPPPPPSTDRNARAGSPPAVSQSAPAASAPAAESRPAQVSAGYRGVNQFAVTYRHDPASAPYSVILHRDGWFSWKLAGVDLSQQ
jgi:hypothetical protein